MIAIARQLDLAILRLVGSPTPAIRARVAVLLAVACGLFYGVVMGTFSGVWDGRTLQLLYSGVKVPMLLGVTFAVALPSFFVLNLLAGVAGDFRDVLRALLAAQAGLTIVLVSLSPLTFFWYASSDQYQLAILVNAACFGTASIAGQILLTRYYRPLERQNPVHRLLRRAWLVVYAFVGIQAGWVLRPFIGQPGSPVEFFRESAWGNAYVEVFSIIRQAFA